MQNQTKYYNIPIFIPEESCPNRCVFCNQNSISNKSKSPSIDEIITIIESNIKTIDLDNSHTMIAFFGGNFTGIETQQQIKYLEAVQQYMKQGIKGIRISTRPDYINENKLEILQRYNVKAIEVGAQSFNDEVLYLSGRGHSVYDIYTSAKLIKKYDFELGLQMMIGLPSDNFEKSLFSVNEIIKLQADTTRIYPTLVIKDTKLEELYRLGKYIPYSLEQAIEYSAIYYDLFEKAEVKVLKLGLHPSDNFTKGLDLIDGPFHISFRELVLTKLWFNRINQLIDYDAKNVCIKVNSKNINYVVGYSSSNKNYFKSKFEKFDIILDNSLKENNFEISYN